MSKKKNKKKKDKKKDKKKNKYKLYYDGGRKSGKKKKNKKYKSSFNKKDKKKLNKYLRSFEAMPEISEFREKCDCGRIDKYLSFSEFEEKVTNKYGIAAASIMIGEANNLIKLLDNQIIPVFCPDCLQPLIPMEKLVNLKLSFEQYGELIPYISKTLSIGAKKNQAKEIILSGKKVSVKVKPLVKIYKNKVKKLVKKGLIAPNLTNADDKKLIKDDDAPDYSKFMG